MARTVAFETPTDPTLFGPDQLRPRAMLALSMRGFATWLAEHLVPYSRLVYDLSAGAVFTAARLDYLNGLRFADADWLITTTRVQVSESAKYLSLDVDLEARGVTVGRRRPVGHFHADLRLVTILEGDGLTAVPGTLPARLFDRFPASERYRPDREALARVTTPPTQRAIVAEHVERGRLGRSQCEVADQWSFIEVIELLTAARERLFLADLPEEIRRLGVSRPSSITAVFHRPLYLFDHYQITTRVFAEGGGPLLPPVVAYEITDPAHDASCVTAWETLAVSREQRWRPLPDQP